MRANEQTRRNRKNEGRSGLVGRVYLVVEEEEDVNFKKLQPTFINSWATE
jgi:hypothetical protein